MALKDQLMADMKEAMKAHDKDRLAVIRMVRGAVRQQEIDGKKELEDSDVIAVISKEVKMRRDSIEEFNKGSRQDLVEKTQAEIDILMPYLPAQLSEDEVRELVKAAVEATGAKTQKDMGKVMGILKPRLAGRADMTEVSRRVKAALASPPKA